MERREEWRVGSVEPGAARQRRRPATAGLHERRLRRARLHAESPFKALCAQILIANWTRESRLFRNVSVACGVCAVAGRCVAAALVPWSLVRSAASGRRRAVCVFFRSAPVRPVAAPPPAARLGQSAFRV